MPVADAARSLLLIVDVQARLMPAIADAEATVANARRLVGAARRLDVPVVYTEQNPRGLGATVDAVAPAAGEPVLSKRTFDAWREESIRKAVPEARELVIAGCEAHVCVLQTVLGALAANRRVKVVADAVGSRRDENRTAALERMRRHGADIVTTEMVVFEWLGSAANPAFKDAIALVK